MLCSIMVCESGVRVVYVVALATFDLAATRAGMSYPEEARMPYPEEGGGGRLFNLKR